MKASLRLLGAGVGPWTSQASDTIVMATAFLMYRCMFDAPRKSVLHASRPGVACFGARPIGRQFVGPEAAARVQSAADSAGTETSISLAAWETRAHFGRGAALPWNRFPVRIDVPDKIWATREILTRPLPVGWDAIPRDVSLRAKGRVPQADDAERVAQRDRCRC